MKHGIVCLASLMLSSIMVLIAAGAMTPMDEVSVSRVTEHCGSWVISFNWSDMDEYSSSTSHSNAESGGVKTTTDMLTLTATGNPETYIRIGILKYQFRDKSKVDQSYLRSLANETIKKAGACENLSYSPREIDGKPGAFISGDQCSGNSVYFVAVYPIDYYYDKSERAITSNAIGMITSSYSEEITGRFITSLKISSTDVDYASRVTAGRISSA